MLSELLQQLSKWQVLDTWIVLSAALAGMACAVPGTYLLLRRQSMMGDALSHTSLLGIVLAFLMSGWLWAAGGTGGHDESETAKAVHGMMFLGAVIIGILAAVFTEVIQKLGRVESTAALGVVFTTMFATGLLLIRLVDKAHIDVDCVLYGSILDMVLNKVSVAGLQIPRAMLMNFGLLLLNVFLVILFYKELQITTFDGELAKSLGLPSTAINYALMAITASTIVGVFESVGSIIVIAMLIVPAATAFLLTTRLEWMIPVSLLVAVLSAVLGHVFAIALPPVLFSRLGFEGVEAASTTGMMAAISGGIFFTALVFAPKQGIVSRYVHQSLLSLKFAADDLLGLLYRMEELKIEEQTHRALDLLNEQLGYRRIIARLAVWRLVREDKLSRVDSEYRLTDQGRESAQKLVRAHRLWESYMAHHFNLSDARLHQSAHRVEHYLDPDLRQDLDRELQNPTEDPHGRTIPEEHQPAQE